MKKSLLLLLVLFGISFLNAQTLFTSGIYEQDSLRKNTPCSACSHWAWSRDSTALYRYLIGQGEWAKVWDTTYADHVTPQQLIDSMSVLRSELYQGVQGKWAYVSTSGIDSTAEIGNINRPYKSISAALAVQDSVKNVFLLPGKHFFKDTLHYNQPIDSIRILGPGATVVIPDDVKGNWFIENNENKDARYIEFGWDHIIDSTINKVFYFYSNSHQDQGTFFKQNLKSYTGYHGEANIGYNGHMAYIYGSANVFVDKIYNPPSGWVHPRVRNERDVSTIRISDILVDVLPTDSVRFDWFNRAQFLNEAPGGNVRIEMENVTILRSAAVDSMITLAQTFGTLFDGTYHLEIGNLKDSLVQNSLDLDNTNVISDTRLGWQVRSLPVEGTLHNVNVRVKVDNANSAAFVTGGTSGLDLDSSYVYIDLGNIQSDTRIFEMYSGDIKNYSTLHVHCDNCVSRNDVAVHIRDASIDATSKLVFSGKWTTLRDSVPVIYTGTNIHVEDIQLYNDGQVPQIHPDFTTRTVYHTNLSSRDSVYEHPLINFVEYDHIGDESSEGSQGGGIFNVVNQNEIAAIDSIIMSPSESIIFRRNTPDGRITNVGAGTLFTRILDGTGDVNGINYSTSIGGDMQFIHDRNSNLSNTVIEFFRRGWTGSTYDITPNGAKMGGIWFSRGTGVGTQARNWMEFNATISDNSNGEGYFSWDIADGDATKNGELLRLTNQTSVVSPYRFNRIGTTDYLGTPAKYGAFDSNGYLITSTTPFVATSTGSPTAGTGFTVAGLQVKKEDNMVCLSGSIGASADDTGITSGTTLIATLPVDYRPGDQIIQTAMTNQVSDDLSTHFAWQISTNGEMKVLFIGGDSFDLDTAEALYVSGCFSVN